MRLIDADEALRMMQNSKTDNPFKKTFAACAWDLAHDSNISCVEACPTVDAVELPCKVGATVYVFDNIVDEDLCKKCPSFAWGGFGDPNGCTKGVGGFRAPKCITISEETATLKQLYWWLHIDAFDRIVFLTREAAEKALAEMRRNDG